MKIVVEMTSEEFQEFLAWKADQKQYERKTEQLGRKYDLMVKGVFWSVEPDPKKAGKYKIVDQDHMHDLYDLALELSD